jgi:hypothetical protein
VSKIQPRDFFESFVFFFLMLMFWLLPELFLLLFFVICGKAVASTHLSVSRAPLYSITDVLMRHLKIDSREELHRRWSQVLLQAVETGPSPYMAELYQQETGVMLKRACGKDSTLNEFAEAIADPDFVDDFWMTKLLPLLTRQTVLVSGSFYRIDMNTGKSPTTSPSDMSTFALDARKFFNIPEGRLTGDLLLIYPQDDAYGRIAIRSQEMLEEELPDFMEVSKG